MRPGAGAPDILAAVRKVISEAAMVRIAGGERTTVREAMGEYTIGCLATVDRRSREPGLVAAAAELGVPIVSFTPAALSDVAVPNPSLRTARALETPSVAESAALLAADRHALAVGKYVFGGITVAAAVIRDR